MSSHNTTHDHPGRTIRNARLAQGLTLRALASQMGMPYSTLSKLENGKMGMSYDKLVKLAQALNLDLGDLASGGGNTNKSHVAPGRRSITRAKELPSAESEFVSHFYPASDLLDKLMVPTIIEVKAKSLEEVGGLVKHAGEEYLYIISGTLELHSELYAPLVLEKGDSIYFDCGMAHAYVKFGDEPCYTLSISTGPGIQNVAGAAGESWKFKSKVGQVGNED